MPDLQDTRTLLPVPLHDFRRESRITPSMPALLVYLLALMPTVYQLPAWTFLSSLLLALLLTVASTRRTSVRLLLCAIYAVGLHRGFTSWSGGTSSYQRLLPRDACRLTAVLRVTGNPTPPGDYGISHPMRVQAMRIHAGWSECTGCVLAHFSPETILRHGETYVVQGSLSPTPANGYGRHLLSLGIRHRLQVERILCVQHPTGALALLSRFFSLRESLGEPLTSGMSPSSAALYQSMLLGRRDLFPSETKMHFLRSSTLHIFAISGLHVVIIHTALLQLLQCVGIGRTLRLLSGSLCCLLYIFLTGATPSSIRSGIMLLLSLVPELLYRPRNNRHSICLAAFLELLCAPLLLYHSGFLYSFIIVAVLIYSTPLLSQLQSLCLAAWCWLPTCPQKHRSLKVPSKLWCICGPLAAAWLSSLPLSLHLNGLFSLGGLLIGLPAQPLATGLVAAAVPKLVLSVLCPPLSRLLGMLMELGMECLVHLAQFGGQSTLCLEGPRLRGLAAAIFLLGLFLLICYGWRITFLRNLACLVILCFLLLGLTATRRQSSAIVVARGQSGGAPALCLLNPEDGPSMLLTAGSPDSANLLLYNLRDRGISAMDVAMETDLHPGIKKRLELATALKAHTLRLAIQRTAMTRKAVQLATAEGTYALHTLETGRRMRIMHLPQGRLSQTRTPAGSKLRCTYGRLNLQLSELPDGSFMLLAHTPHQAHVALLSPRSQGSFLILPLDF